MKRTVGRIALLLVISMLIGLVAGCSQPTTAITTVATTTKGSASAGTTVAPTTQATSSPANGAKLTMFAIGSVEGGMYETIAKTFVKDHPGFTLEVTSIEGVTDFNTALAAKVSAGNIPDLIDMQWDTQITKYAQNGYIVPLDDTGVGSLVATIKKPINVINGKTYAYPVIQSLWSMMWNRSLAKKYGVDYIPKTIDELITSFATMRSKGLQYPYLTAGKDLSGATWFIMAYLHQEVSGTNPDFYYQIATGQKSWAGPEIRKMYEQYARLLEYAPKDFLGVDTTEFNRRFAREEFVMSIGGTGGIVTLRSLNPNLDFVLAPAPCNSDVSKYNIISDFNNGLVVGKTKNEAAAKEFYKAVFLVENGNMIAKTLNGISPVKNTNPGYDPSIEINLPFLASGNFVGFSERDWIPGIRDVLKKNTQDWFSGALTLDQALNSLQAEHERLLKATPTYLDDYKALRTAMGMKNN